MTRRTIRQTPPSEICTHWTQADQFKAYKQGWFMERKRVAPGKFIAKPIALPLRRVFKEDIEVMTFLEHGLFNQDPFATRAWAFIAHQNEARVAGSWDKGCGEYHGRLRWLQTMQAIERAAELGYDLSQRYKRRENPKRFWRKVHQYQTMLQGWALWRGPGNLAFIVRCTVNGAHVFSDNSEAEQMVYRMWKHGKGGGAAIHAVRFITQQQERGYVTAWEEGVRNKDIPGAQPDLHMANLAPISADRVAYDKDQERRAKCAIRYKIPRVRQRLMDAGVITKDMGE